MPDRIYTTYTPTTVPGTFHATIHYERTDSTGKMIKHVVIEARPENLDALNASGKGLGVLEEMFRNGNGPSRFGRIAAGIRELESNNDPSTPYETIAEGDDLSENLARMQLYATGINRAGFAYRGDRQNSNTFASGALRAGELPAPTGIARDPLGPPGELLEFFAPGLNESLEAPIDSPPNYGLAPSVPNRKQAALTAGEPGGPRGLVSGKPKETFQIPFFSPLSRR
jgi:hypothetical protein